MTISPVARLLLYIAMAILPVWIDFFKVSTDYSLRGLAMPILTSLNAAVVVMLAKTSPVVPSKKDETPPVTASD